MYLLGLENTYLIPMRELLKLSEWIAVTVKVEDKSHRDLWQKEEAIQGDMDGDTGTQHKNWLVLIIQCTYYLGNSLYLL